MKKQEIALKSKRQSEKEILLSVGLLLATTGSLTPVHAQSAGPDSYLPPQVVPVNSAVNYGTSVSNQPIPGYNPSGNVSTNGPLQAIPTADGQVPLQSAQEARQALFNSLMGTNVYPQLSGGQSSSYNEMGNMAGVQNACPNMPQTLSNGQLGQPNFNLPSQYNNLMSSPPSQTQTLTGAVNTPSTSQPRTGGGVMRAVSVLAGVGMTGLSFANSGAGNIYSGGLLGASGVNYGLRNGFSF